MMPVPAHPASPYPLRRSGFLILHGWQNHRPAGHWQHRLADALAAAGAQVHYPQLPDADAPSLPAWSVQMRRAAEQLTAEHRVVICFPG